MEKAISFSKKLKKELADIEFTCSDCQTAELYGMLLFGRSLTEITVSFSTEHKSVVDRFVSNVIDVTSAIVTIKYFGSRYHKDGKLYVASVEDELDSELIKDKFSFTADFTTLHLLEKDCCKSAFLRGAFMACGSIIDPQKEYHLEFVVPTLELADKLKRYIESFNIPIKNTVRKNISVLYLKESENIEDIITLMGAVYSSLEIMNVKILKDVRNKINRVTNCETANIGKTVAASSKQIEDIEYIKAKKGLSFLSDDLKELAEIRLENPDLSLRELCELLSEPISRSGVNHRLKRLQIIADEIRHDKKEL